MSRRIARSVVPAMLSTLVLVGTVACAAGPEASDDRPLVYANPQLARNESMDPANQSGLPAGQPVWLLYDRLVHYSLDGGAQPDLATEWTVSDDGTEYTFTLRDDVTFHDGTPFNADAVKFSFDRIVTFEGQQAYNYLNSVYVGTEVLEEHLVKVTIARPSPEFLYQVSRQVFGIVSPSAVAELGDEAFGLNPVGTGPYKFEELVSGDHVTLVRNEDYTWGPEVFAGAPHLSGVTFRYIPETSTRITALTTGEVTLIEDPPVHELDRLEADESVNIVSNRQAGLSASLELNVTAFPTDDIEVRKAINFAIDKEAINDAVFFGRNTPTYSILGNPNMLGYDESIGTSRYRFDPEEAGRLLDAAGWVVGSGEIREKDGQRLTLQFITDTSSTLEELVQAQLREVGIEVDVVRLDPAGAAAAWANSEHNMTLGNGGLYGRSNPLASIMMTGYTCSQIGAFNTSRFCDEDFDSLMGTAVSTVDDDERAALYRQVQEVLADQAVNVPLYANTKVWASASDLTGIEAWDAGGVYLRMNGAQWQ